MSNQDTTMIDYDGYSSDDSSFYGDEATKAHFEHLASTFSPKDDYYSIKQIIPTVEAREAKYEQLAAIEKVSKLWSPGAGSEAYRQLSESPAEFLKRMAPTSRAAAKHAWLWVYDPHLGRDDQVFTQEVHHEKIELECRRVLDDLEAEVESRRPQMAAGSLEKKMAPSRKQAEDQIHEIAQENGSVSGKWMLFPGTADVTKKWLKVVEATVAGELGCSAKVGITDRSDGLPPPQTGSRKRKKGDSWAIFVYTKDFNDRDDVGRVHKILRDRSIIGAREAISYISDVMSEVGVCANNKWKISPYKYTSRDFTLKRKSVK